MRARSTPRTSRTDGSSPRTTADPSRSGTWTATRRSRRGRWAPRARLGSPGVPGRAEPGRRTGRDGPRRLRERRLGVERRDGRHSRSITTSGQTASRRSIGAATAGISPSATYGGSLHVLDADDGGRRNARRLRTGPSIRAVAFAPDGRTIAVATYNQRGSGREPRVDLGLRGTGRGRAGARRRERVVARLRRVRRTARDRVLRRDRRRSATPRRATSSGRSVRDRSPS